MNITILELEEKKLVLYFLYRLKTNHIRLNNLTLKKIPKQNFHSLLFISKRSFICCNSFINFIVAVYSDNTITVVTDAKNLRSNKILVT